MTAVLDGGPPCLQIFGRVGSRLTNQNLVFQQGLFEPLSQRPGAAPWSSINKLNAPAGSSGRNRPRSTRTTTVGFRNSRA